MEDSYREMSWRTISEMTTSLSVRNRQLHGFARSIKIESVQVCIRSLIQE